MAETPRGARPCLPFDRRRSDEPQQPRAQAFQAAGRTAGLPEDATLYTLRHTFATLWLESKEPVKVLQEILGHSRIDVTMNVYAHVLPHIQEEAMGRFAERLRVTDSTLAGP